MTKQTGFFHRMVTKASQLGKSVAFEDALKRALVVDEHDHKASRKKNHKRSFATPTKQNVFKCRVSSHNRMKKPGDRHKTKI